MAAGNPEFRGKVDEAKAIRNEMAAERIWGMSVDESDHHVRGRLAACAMIQQSLAMQRGGELRNRPRHVIEQTIRNEMAGAGPATVQRPDSGPPRRPLKTSAHPFSGL